MFLGFSICFKHKYLKLLDRWRAASEANCSRRRFKASSLLIFWWFSIFSYFVINRNFQHKSHTLFTDKIGTWSSFTCLLTTTSRPALRRYITCTRCFIYLTRTHGVKVDVQERTIGYPSSNRERRSAKRGAGVVFQFWNISFAHKTIVIMPNIF